MKSRITPLSMVRDARHKWRSLTPDSIRGVPRAVRPWICLCSSMTKRIEKVAGQGVTVAVLRDAPGRLHFRERGILDAAQTTGHVREVVLSVAGQALLVARTVFIARRLRASRKLRTLGARPLGEMLFLRGDAVWRMREFARVTSRLPICAAGAAPLPHRAGDAWARRTMFVLDGCPILVTEILLPALLDLEPRVRPV